MGEVHFCTTNNKCGVNEGGCNYDTDCEMGLRCGIEKCPVYLGFDSNVNCCSRPTNGHENFCTTNHACGHYEGDCDNDNECLSGLKCGIDNCPPSLGFNSSVDCCYNQTLLNVGDMNFCTENDTCAENEGGCYTDSDCQSGLKCGTNNCPPSLGFDPKINCCYQSCNFPFLEYL